jgi:hypothetical protein
LVTRTSLPLSDVRLSYRSLLPTIITATLALPLIGVNRQRRGSSRAESSGCRLGFTVDALATPGYTNNGGVQRDFSTSILFNIKISAPDHGALTAA